MPFAENQQILHYRLTEKIGEGGMGVVWSAVDTTLDRQVAIKVLPELLAADPERLARFEREAKLLAALDHPNIASVYGLHEFDGQRFIAMELVPGEDLAERLERGPIAVDDAIDIARQTAAALEAAHEQGVIHRDLKPANIKCTPDGKVKVLDLGLAKALVTETSGDSPSISLSPTVTSAGTIAGTLLGTAAYMSPEQAKGRPVDRRADIWAFGVVLYEMLTGRNPFVAETISETLAAVLRDEACCQSLPEGTPSHVSFLVERCLDRDVDGRLRDIGEARIALTGGASVLMAPSETGEPAPEVIQKGASKLPWLLVALLSFVTIFALWSALQPQDEPGERYTLSAELDPDWTVPAHQMGILALSPDGKRMAVTLRKDSKSRLFVRSLEEGGWLEVPGTEDAATPFFSPDSQWIAYFADDKLMKVPATGGTPISICDAQGQNRGGTWGSDDQIIFSPHFTMPLMTVSASGGTAVPLTEVDNASGERTHRWPHAVPNEDLVIFTVGTVDSPESYEAAEIHAIRPTTGERTLILERASMARYLSSGHLVFGREGFLFAVRFDVDRLKIIGSPVPVVEDVMGMTTSGIVHVGFAENGTFAYFEGGPRAREERMVWSHRDGSVEAIPAAIDGYLNPAISPDGKRVALQIPSGTRFDIWIYDLERDALTRLTFEGDNIAPQWSLDGKQIVYSSIQNNALRSIYQKAADGSGEAVRLLETEKLSATGRIGQVIPWGWFDGGRALLVEYADENSSNLGYYVPETDEFVTLLDTPATENTGAISPDGRWLAYGSDEQGDFHLFVTEFPALDGKWQVSDGTGLGARWSPDGRYLFYRESTRLLSVPIDVEGGRFRAGTPEVVVDDMREVRDYYDYAIMDSDRFLIVEPVGREALTSGVTVVINWDEELGRLVPN